MAIFNALGPYHIVRRIGKGGMGDVYLADDTRKPENDPTRRVALKVMWRDLESDTASVLEAERQGAQLQARLYGIDNRVARVNGFGDLEDCFYVDMEYIEGRDLAELIANGPVEPLEAGRIGIEIADILLRAHTMRFEYQSHDSRGVVHGDIKPRNIRIDATGRVRLMDFGIAKALSMTRKLTRNEFGSVSYSSPERLDTGEVNEQSDLWALAVVLYEMLDRGQPFLADNTRKIEQLILARTPPRPLGPNVPKVLKEVLARALAPRLENRYLSAVHFKKALQTAVSQLRVERQGGPNFQAWNAEQAAREAAREAASRAASHRVPPPASPSPATRTGADGATMRSGLEPASRTGADGATMRSSIDPASRTGADGATMRSGLEPASRTGADGATMRSSIDPAPRTGSEGAAMRSEWPLLASADEADATRRTLVPMHRDPVALADDGTAPGYGSDSSRYASYAPDPNASRHADTFYSDDAAGFAANGEETARAFSPHAPPAWAESGRAESDRAESDRTESERASSHARPAVLDPFAPTAEGIPGFPASSSSALAPAGQASPPTRAWSGLLSRLWPRDASLGSRFRAVLLVIAALLLGLMGIREARVAMLAADAVQGINARSMNCEQAWDAYQGLAAKSLLHLGTGALEDPIVESCQAEAETVMKRYLSDNSTVKSTDWAKAHADLLHVLYFRPSNQIRAYERYTQGQTERIKSNFDKAEAAFQTAAGLDNFCDPFIAQMHMYTYSPSMLDPTRVEAARDEAVRRGCVFERRMAIQVADAQHLQAEKLYAEDNPSDAPETRKPNLTQVKTYLETARQAYAQYRTFGDSRTHLKKIDKRLKEVDAKLEEIEEQQATPVPAPKPWYSWP